LFLCCCFHLLAPFYIIVFIRISHQ
jgi:hypothetical protein